MDIAEFYFVKYAKGKSSCAIKLGTVPPKLISFVQYIKVKRNTFIPHFLPVSDVTISNTLDNVSNLFKRGF